MVWNNLGILVGMQGNYSLAQENYQKALHLAREIGNRRGEGLVLGNLGWIAGNLGDYTSARSFCEQHLRIANETDDQETRAYNIINLCSLAERQGDYQTALMYAEQALALTARTGDRSAQAWAYTYAGHVYLGLGQPARAVELFRRGLQIRQELGQPNLACEPGAGLTKAQFAASQACEAARAA